MKELQLHLSLTSQRMQASDQLHPDHAWFQASAAKQMRSALYWDITQGIVVIHYRRFGTIYLSHLQGSRNPRRTPWIEDYFPVDKGAAG